MGCLRTVTTGDTAGVRRYDRRRGRMQDVAEGASRSDHHTSVGDYAFDERGTYPVQPSAAVVRYDLENREQWPNTTSR